MTTLRVGRTLGGMDPVFHPPRQEDLTNGANLRGLTVVPDAARWLSERHEIETDDGPRVVQTAHATRKLEMGVLLTSSLPALLADDECAHGRLATDPTPPCGCWPNELHTEPEELVVTAITEAHHGSSATDAADPDAPYGRKTDGTPRKKPAPSPEHIAAIQRGHAERKAARLAAEAATAATAATQQYDEPIGPEPRWPEIRDHGLGRGLAPEASTDDPVLNTLDVLREKLRVVAVEADDLRAEAESLEARLADVRSRMQDAECERDRLDTAVDALGALVPA